MPDEYVVPKGALDPEEMLKQPGGVHTYQDWEFRQKIFAIRSTQGYRTVFLLNGAIKQFCLACEKEVPEGELCCIGWRYELEFKHRSFPDTMQRFEQEIKRVAPDSWRARQVA